MRAGMMGIVSCLICDVVSYFINEKKDFVDLQGHLELLPRRCQNRPLRSLSPPLPAASSSTSSPVRPLAWPPTSPPSSAASGDHQPVCRNAHRHDLGCMLLGMALPTVAAYLVGCHSSSYRLSCALWVSPLWCANMFVFYYGIMAQITPPVCRSILHRSRYRRCEARWKTGMQGHSPLQWSASIVPFVIRLSIPLSCWKARCRGDRHRRTAPDALLGTYLLALRSLSLATCSSVHLKTCWSASPCYIAALHASSLPEVHVLPSSAWCWTSCVHHGSTASSPGKKNANKAQPA